MLSAFEHAFAIECPPDVLRVTQVHGSRVIVVTEPLASDTEADALCTATPGLAIGVRSADCVPILMACLETRTVAAVHAGWRGQLAGVVDNAVDALQRSIGRSTPLVAVLGPSIGPCCFEVGPEVAEQFHPSMRINRPGRKDTVDLRRAVRHSLLSKGLSPGNVFADPPCTHCHPELPSYRRDGAAAGRLVSWIRCPAT